MILTDEYFRFLSREEIDRLFSLLPQLRKIVDDCGVKNNHASYGRYTALIGEAIKQGDDPTSRREAVKSLFMKLIDLGEGFWNADELRDVVLARVDELSLSRLPSG